MSDKNTRHFGMRRLWDHYVGARDLHNQHRASVANDLQRDYEPSSSSLVKVFVHRETYRLLYQYFGNLDNLEPSNNPPPELIVAVARCRDELTTRVMRDARGAHNSGQLNSTDAFTRAIEAAKLSATAELAEFMATTHKFLTSE